MLGSNLALDTLRPKSNLSCTDQYLIIDLPHWSISEGRRKSLLLAVRATAPSSVWECSERQEIVCKMIKLSRLPI